MGLATISTGCKKGCSDVHCRSYGYISSLNTYTAEVCNNGTCYCPNGFEGDSCQILSAYKFIHPTASWLVSDACSLNGSNYYVNIYSNYPQTNVNVLLINGLFGGGAQVEADIISNASHQGINLNVPPQVTPSGSINGGSGVYQSSCATCQGKITLSLDYTSNSTGIETNCTVIMYQQ
jgi:hypothetical protein